MNNYTIGQILLLEQLVSSIIEQSEKVASMIDTEQELMDDLRQTAIALRYLTQALESRVGLRVFSTNDEQLSQN